MSTNAAIIVKHRDGTWTRVYCHWDGYLAGVGVTLRDHYTSQGLAETLVAGGDISRLGPRCDLPPGHTFKTPVDGYTIYYVRDRGEVKKPAKIFDTLFEALPPIYDSPEFIYVWNKTHGWFLMTDRFTPLDRAFAEAGL